VSGSASERAIRDAVASRLGQMLPEARIIHELVVGGCRADLAAVTEERVTLVETKSERDTLKRLPEQVRQFERAAHEVIVVAHERWFDTSPYRNGSPRFVPCEDLAAVSGQYGLWAYPEITDRPVYGSWSLHRFPSTRPEPHAARLLEMCWRAELLEECHRHRIAVGSRATRPVLIRDMAWLLSGKEIARAVCRQLRKREFPEAGPVMLERVAA